MVESAFSRDMKLWLQDKPIEWAQIIAVRAAMRVLPYINGASRNWLESNAILPFRALALAWAAKSVPTHDWQQAAIAAARVAWDAADGIDASPAYAPSDAAYSAVLAVNAPLSEAIDLAADAVDAYSIYDNSKPASARTAKVKKAELWMAAEADYRWLMRHMEIQSAAQSLSEQPLWHVAEPAGFIQTWLRLREQLLEIDKSFAVWTDWFDRRVEGNSSAFDIPGDHDRIEDRDILISLGSVTESEFWAKGATYVNVTLQAWIDEARELVAPPIPAILPSQNPNAVAFRQGSDGKIAIDTSIDLNALRTDPDARDRHAELRRDAAALLAKCQGSNAGARLTGFLENYIAALGESNENQRPSLLVQRGNRLDVESKAYGDPSTLLNPLADDVLLDLGSLVSAHNMHVMSEPMLRDRATAMLGPDVQLVMIAPDEIKAVAKEADEYNLLALGVLSVIEEAADIAPVVPDPQNRFTIWSTETITNLIIEAFTIALRHPVETAIVGGVATVLPTGLDFGTAVIATGYLMHRRTWIESKLGNSPTWKALFIDLCNRMGKFIPPSE